MDLYREQLLDHYHHPHNTGELTDVTHRQKGVNPLCGDEITVFIKKEGASITDITFIGTGCVISQAAASLLTDTIKGERVEVVLGWTFETMHSLLGVTIPPSRLQCALLALETVKLALKDKAQ